MYCLIQFYHQVNKDIKEHHPFIKILSIKLVIFLSFWQSVCFPLAIVWISLLTALTDLDQPPDVEWRDLTYEATRDAGFEIQPSRADDQH